MLTLKEIDKLNSDRTENRILCPNCGHSMLLGRKDKKICSNCGIYVFKDKTAEFHYRMREQMLKEKKQK